MTRMPVILFEANTRQEAPSSEFTALVCVLFSCVAKVFWVDFSVSGNVKRFLDISAGSEVFSAVTMSFRSFSSLMFQVHFILNHPLVPNPGVFFSTSFFTLSSSQRHIALLIFFEAFHPVSDSQVRGSERLWGLRVDA